MGKWILKDYTKNEMFFENDFQGNETHLILKCFEERNQYYNPILKKKKWINNVNSKMKKLINKMWKIPPKKILWSNLIYLIGTDVEIGSF